MRKYTYTHSELRNKKISEANKGRKLTPEWKENLRKAGIGRIQSIETRVKISIANKNRIISEKGKNNIRNARNGRNIIDNSEYQRIHKWIKKNTPLSTLCEYCGNRKKLEYANISQQYLIETSDWLLLCRSCHLMFDNDIKGQLND